MANEQPQQPGGIDALVQFLEESSQLNPRERAILRQEVFDAKIKPQWQKMTLQERQSVGQAFNQDLAEPIAMPPMEGTWTKQAMNEIRPPWGRAEEGASPWEQTKHVAEGVRRGITPPSLDIAVGKMRGFEIPESDPRSQGGYFPPFLNILPSIGMDVANKIGVPEGYGFLGGALAPAAIPLLMKFPRLAAPLINMLRRQMSSPIAAEFKAGMRSAPGASAAPKAPELPMGRPGPASGSPPMFEPKPPGNLKIDEGGVWSAD